MIGCVFTKGMISEGEESFVVEVGDKEDRFFFTLQLEVRKEFVGYKLGIT